MKARRRNMNILGWERKYSQKPFFLISLFHAHIGNRACIDQAECVERVRLLFTCETILVAKEGLHEGHNLHVAVLFARAPRRTFGDKVRSAFPEFPALEITPCYSHTQLLLLCTQFDRNPLVSGEPVDWNALKGKRLRIRRKPRVRCEDRSTPTPESAIEATLPLVLLHLPHCNKPFDPVAFSLTVILNCSIQWEEWLVVEKREGKEITHSLAFRNILLMKDAEKLIRTAFLERGLFQFSLDFNPGIESWKSYLNKATNDVYADKGEHVINGETEILRHYVRGYGMMCSPWSEEHNGPFWQLMARAERMRYFQTLHAGTPYVSATLEELERTRAHYDIILESRGLSGTTPKFSPSELKELFESLFGHYLFLPSTPPKPRLKKVKVSCRS